MGRVILWEFGKLVRLRSGRVGLLVAFLLPFLWALAPTAGLNQIYGLILVSGWQVPALALLAGMNFLFPFLCAMASAEVIGSEVAQGTLKSLMLRPFPRSGILLAKIVTVLVYPYLLLLASLLGSFLAGAIHGFSSFAGGTGLGAEGFAGVGLVAPAQALAEILRAYALAGLVLWPISVLALLFAVVFLSTTAAALAAVASILLMQLLSPFIFLRPFLLTTYLGLYSPSTYTQTAGLLGLASAQAVVPQGLVLLMIYAVGFAALAVLVFDRKDV
ncbi:MAG TPA: ABC transporter permease [Meiothermus sp.]|nr:ABC transporter permease [Meiothermus sp.]